MTIEWGSSEVELYCLNTPHSIGFEVSGGRHENTPSSSLSVDGIAESTRVSRSIFV